MDLKTVVKLYHNSKELTAAAEKRFMNDRKDCEHYAVWRVNAQSGAGLVFHECIISSVYNQTCSLMICPLMKE